MMAFDAAADGCPIPARLLLMDDLQWRKGDDVKKLDGNDATDSGQY